MNDNQKNGDGKEAGENTVAALRFLLVAVAGSLEGITEKEARALNIFLQGLLEKGWGKQ